MRRTLFSAIAILLFLSSLAQNNVGELKGVVVGADRSPVPYVSVVANMNGQHIAGCLSDETGTFSLQVPRSEKPYDISFISMSSRPLTKSVVVNHGIVAMDTIVLRNQMLDAVEISTQSNPKSVTVEHVTITPNSSMADIKGSVLDVLKNEPSVSVDNEGNVSIRGNSKVLVLQNGIPTVMTSLSSLPYANVANIEIINNPDATHDAEGTGGIINIVMKDNRSGGFSGMASVNYGFNHFTNGNVAFHYTKKKFTFRFSYNVKYEDDVIYGTLNRRFKQSDYSLNQQFNTLRTSFNNNVGLGATFRINPRNTLIVDVHYRMPRLNRQQSFVNTFWIDGRERLENRSSDVSWNRENLDGSVSYNHVIKPKALVLNVVAAVSKIWGHRPSYYFLEGDSVGKSNSGGSPLNSSAQCDFKIMKPYGVWEMGAKFSFRQNHFYHEYFNYENEAWIFSDYFSRKLLHREYIPAAYMQFTSRQDKPIFWKAGLRVEYSRTQLLGDDVNKHSNFTLVAPNAMLNYKVKSKNPAVKQSVSLAYSCRVGRPTYPQLNPYMSMIDANTYEQGNMGLIPEGANQLELAYDLGVKILHLNANVYAKYILNNITQVAKQKDDILLLTYENGKYELNAGLEANLRINPMKWMEILLASNTFYSRARGVLDNVDIDNQGWNNNSNVMLVFHPVKSMSIQMQYFLSSPQHFPQFTTAFSHYMNIGLSQKFLKGSLTVTALLTDVFNTNNWDIYSDNRIYYLTNTSFNKSRMFWLGLSYNFNSFKAGKSVVKPENDKERLKLGL